MCAIGDKYYKEAIEKKLPIEIKYKEETMTIPYSELLSRVMSYNPKETYIDKITFKPYFLIYYK